MQKLWSSSNPAENAKQVKNLKKEKFTCKSSTAISSSFVRFLFHILRHETDILLVLNDVVIVANVLWICHMFSGTFWTRVDFSTSSCYTTTHDSSHVPFQFSTNPVATRNLFNWKPPLALPLNSRHSTCCFLLHIQFDLIEFSNLRQKVCCYMCCFIFIVSCRVVATPTPSISKQNGDTN